MQPATQNHQRLFFVALVLLLCGGFFLAQMVYIHRLPLVMDEFVGAYHAYQFVDQVPYVDFKPYKTIFGYYIHAFLLHLAPDHWSGLMLVKTYLATLNSVMLAVGALELRRHVRPAAVIAALVLMMVMSTFLERASELRLDMTTAWVAFISLSALLRGRPGAAGILVALSYLVSQKAAYYVVAGGVALGTYWLFGRRTRDELRAFLRYCGFAGAMLGIYLLVWYLAASVGTVSSSVFPTSRTLLLENPYSFDLRFHYWSQSIWRNPAYYALVFVALWQLELRRRTEPENRTLWLALAYGATVVGACFWHRHAWPYFMVMMYPSVLVLHAFMFDGQIKKLEGKRFVVAGMTVPVLLVVLALGVVHPLRRVEVVLDRDQSRQEYAVGLAEWLLGEGETYLGGVPYLYRREQVHRAFKSLDQAQKRRLKRMDDQQIEQIIETLKSSKMKFVIYSYRTNALPRKIKKYLKRNYHHMSGNIGIYAPRIGPKAEQFRLAFEGRYVLYARRPVLIDGSRFEPGDRVYLTEGTHRFAPAEHDEQTVRLKLEPSGLGARVDRKFRKRGAMFPKMYDY